MKPLKYVVSYCTGLLLSGCVLWRVHRGLPVVGLGECAEYPTNQPTSGGAVCADYPTNQPTSATECATAIGNPVKPPGAGWPVGAHERRAALGTRTSGVLRASDASLVVYECVGERSNSARRLRLVQQAAFER